MLPLLLACVDPTDSAEGGSASDSGDVVSTLPTEVPLAEVDVLVIGAGAGGLASAWAARDAGASVIIVEREVVAGGATPNAGNYWAAGTSWQADGGVEDSAALALSEWSSFTGGDGDSPVVQAFVEGSAGVLDWLVSLGAGFDLSIAIAADTGSKPRFHQLSHTSARPPVNAVAETLVAESWFQTTATELVLDGDDVAGVWVTDAAGARGWIHAAAVVVATGGFTRNDAIVFEALPALEAQDTWIESFPGMDGNGLAMAGAAGAAEQNMDHLGIYAHGVADAKIGQPEVMVIAGLDSALVVDAAGVRVTDERQFGSVSMGTRYLTEGPFYAIADDVLWTRLSLQGRGFNYLEDPEGIMLTAAAYEALVPVAQGEDAEALGSALGIDGAGLAASLDRYNTDAATGTDTEFGKPSYVFTPLGKAPFRGLPIVLGRAKSFGGLATNIDGAVLRADGSVIVGLYAAGEACGFLGDPAIGSGLNGSVTSAWWSGLRSGAAAAGAAGG